MDSSTTTNHQPDEARTSILLVDDDPAILEGMTDLLNIYGYRVITACNGREALAAMQRELPDIIISDILMPDMDGYDFLRAVRSNPSWTPIPFIFLTAYGQRKDIRHGHSLGVDAYLTKPFEPEDLVVLIESRLRRMRELHEIARMDVERMKQQLVIVFSHELRTPLTYIYGYVDMLREQYAELDQATIETMLDGIKRGAERLKHLVEDLMLVIQLDSGVLETEIALRRAPALLSAIVEEVIERYRHVAEERHVTLEADVPPHLRVLGVALYLQDALGRLVDNAIKFCKRQGGHVAITAEEQGECVVLRVSDDGIGIDPAHLEAIFERFSQVDRERLEQQGVGLGLTIARDLVQLHGGRITVESQPGVGSTFTVTLPSAGGGLG